METAAFLSHVWPTSGHKFILTKSAEDKPYIHRAFEHGPPAAESALAFDAKEELVYFSCASFVEPYVERGELNAYGRPKRQYRIQDNAGWAKALWLDLDCGEGKDYPDQKSAVADVVRACTELQIARPLFVSSGRGIHAYWVFTVEIRAAVWRKLAQLWRAVLDHLQVRHDPSRTADIASVLRPVGTHNRKNGVQRSVKVVGKVPEAVDHLAIARSLVDYSTRNKLSLRPAASTHKPRSHVNDDLSLQQEFPPSSAHQLADRCLQVQVFRDAKGDVQEPLWYAMLGLLKHTVEADTVAHEWSTGHPDYDANATQTKLDQWSYGPPLCDRFAKLNPAGCAGCRFAGKIKSPIQLGQVLPQATEEQVQAAVAPVPEAEMPSNALDFKIPAHMSAMFSRGADGLYMRVEDPETGPQVIRFSPTVLFPTGYYDRAPVGEKDQRSTWRVLHRGAYTDFELPAAVQLVGAKDLFTILGRAGVIVDYGGKKAMERYIHEWFNELRSRTDEIPAYATFGWQKDGSFLLGETLFRADGTHKDVKVQGDAQKYTEAFEPKGSAEQWAELIDQVYNHPGDEQYQWMLGTGFGAPLVALMGNMAGCVVNGFSRESGLGKSTAGKLGLGLYGNPEKLMLTKQQATTKGLFAYAGVMNSLPILLDELTNTKGYELSDLVYTFSQGTGRMGAQSDGSLRTNVYGWATLMASTSNRSAQTTLAASKAAASPEIARVFEYRFVKSQAVMSRVEYDRLFEQALSCYGAAGRVYIQYLTTNKEKVTKLLQKVRENLVKVGGIRQEERFWAAGASVILTGLLIGSKLGLIKFNIPALMDWALRQVTAMREVVGESESSFSELFGLLLHEVSSGFLVTDREGDARSQGDRANVLHSPHGELTGRVVAGTQTLYMPISVLRNWCSEKQVDYRQMAQDLLLRGWLKVEKVPVSLGRGTTGFATTPTRCYSVNLALAGGEIGQVDSINKLRSVK